MSSLTSVPLPLDLPTPSAELKPNADTALGAGQANHEASTTLVQVLNILSKEYKIQTAGFGPDTTLADTGLDSLSIADLLFEVEDVFQIKLDEMSPSDMPTHLSGLVDLIDAKLNA